MNEQNSSQYSQPARTPVYTGQAAQQFPPQQFPAQQFPIQQTVQQYPAQQAVSGLPITGNNAPVSNMSGVLNPVQKPANTTDSGEQYGELKEKHKKRRKRTAKDYAISLLIKLCATAAAVAILLAFVCGVYVCHNNSSYPMIKDGDLCVTSKLSSISQGDEIAYVTEDGVAFGRVIAFGSDTVDISDGNIIVNGLGLYEDVIYPTEKDGAMISFPYTVPENCVFVLNDYRSDSNDSRSFGGIDKKDTRGKVVLIMRRRGI